MGRYIFDLPEGKRTIVSTHGYWFTFVVGSDPRIVTNEGKVDEIGLVYSSAIDDLEGDEYDAEDDGWAFIKGKLEAYFAARNDGEVRAHDREQ